MSERERLESILQAAGFTHRDGWGKGKWHREVDRPGGGCVDVVDLQDDGNASYTQVCALSDLPALLSPSSPVEVADEAVKAFDAVLKWVGTWEPTLMRNMRDEGVLGAVEQAKAHLQQHTQTTPAPEKDERFHQLTPDEVMEEITRQGLAATTKEGNGE